MKKSAQLSRLTKTGVLAQISTSFDSVHIRTFVIRFDRRLGTFGVEAIKPEDGYIAFAGTSAKKMVTLIPSQLSATVALKLGPKPGVLLLPSVKDKLTGEPIMSFQVSWEISGPNGSVSGGEAIGQGIKRTRVPPEKYFRLTISAPGYTKWIYHDPSDPSRPALVRFQPGEEKELLVELEPQAPAAR